MKQRILTAVLLIPLALTIILLASTPFCLAIVALLLLLALWEWTRLAGVKNRLLRATTLAAHAALFAWLAWRGWPELFPWIALLGIAWWLIASLWLAHFQFAAIHRPRNHLLKLAAGTAAIVPAWCAFALLHADPDNGPRWALFALAQIWVADSCAYFIGRRYGHRKLAPRISPGKTQAGLWGALFGASLAALVAGPLLGVPFAQLPALVLLGLLTTLASIIGDLFESLIKRHAGAKDSSGLLPGHGGMLDRIDSLLAALPVFALGKEYIGL